MWNKRKEEEYPPKSASVPATSASQAKENPPMSTAPATSHYSPEMRGPAVIGKSVMIKGQIFSREDLTIDGEIDGSVELQEHRLTVGPHGKLQAGVKAREIVVLGTIHGNVEASDKIDIRKDAKLVGDIKTARIVIEDGAYFKGSIDIARPEISKPAAVPAPKPAVAAPASPAANAAAASAPSSALSGELKR
jgi:cytoskeletal protein CcmA (bactofilin family)